MILNGASSSGKTTIAHAVRDGRGPSCAVVSIDQFYASVHPERENNWSLFYSLTEVMFASVAAFVERGFDVVVDTVFERRECVEVCRRALEGVHVLFVGLTCPVDVLECRERARENRPVGLARDQSGRIHNGCVYDLTLDTSELSVDACAARIHESFW